MKKYSARASFPLGLVLMACVLISAPTRLAADSTPVPTYTITTGPFQPTWDSLKAYQCPEWFRDAKFGIWATWDPQSVPGNGDWYAFGMYQQTGFGDDHYKYQIAHYGHPSKFGYKDLCNLWKAEKWDPEKLIELFKQTGAQYFVALANHHDNFDCWNSTYQPWNSVNIGPHKDIVGGWAEAARKNGLRFGVSVHNARSWNWISVSQGSDKTGPLKDVPYDGNLTKADGKGQWWEGYDPADLYTPAGAARTAAAYQTYITKWFNRTKDLIDKYHPDLLYFDDDHMPLDDAGMNIAAHYYNANTQWHRGQNEAVLNIKGTPPGDRSAIILDLERKVSDQLDPLPWQTDDCLGDWHYNSYWFEQHHYQGVPEIVHMLCDIVSKNGNLLFNIPLRGDGSLDDDEIKFLRGMAAWMKINSEAIYGTRPWVVPQDKPTDTRFTTRGDSLYAIVLRWPDSNKLIIRELAADRSPWISTVNKVEMLGSNGPVIFAQTPNGMTFDLPNAKPADFVALVFKLTGRGSPVAALP